MNETIEYQNIHGNRNFKDSLFRMVFKEKEHLLDLYNAVNGTDYDNPDELEINTLENVLYISMKNDLDLFSTKIQKIPTPKYIVFYNGEHNEPDERIMRLSDAFIKEGGCLECEVKLLNINYGRNRELMEKCRRLEEYAIFIAAVRKYKKDNHSLKKAITFAIDECIKKGVLLDILTKQRNEVLRVLLETFN